MCLLFLTLTLGQIFECRHAAAYLTCMSVATLKGCCTPCKLMQVVLATSTIDTSVNNISKSKLHFVPTLVAVRLEEERKMNNLGF